MIPVLVIGKSGAGKSFSAVGLPTEGTVVINVLGKPLPFKSHLKTVKCSDYKKIKAAISKGGYSRYVIDDFGYLMTDQFMSALSARGKGGDVFQYYTDIGLTLWDFIKSLLDNPSDSRVYLLMHEEQDDYGNIKPRAFGKLVEQKVCLEGMVTICLRAAVDSEQRHIFITQSDGMDTAKSPLGLFDSAHIDNDLGLVDKAIVEYYDIKEENEHEAN